jgi:hypothetical protein
MGGANGPPDSVFLARWFARQFDSDSAIPSKVAPQAATDGHVSPRMPFLIRLAGPASPAEFFYLHLLCATNNFNDKSAGNPAKTHAAGKAGLRV